MRMVTRTNILFLNRIVTIIAKSLQGQFRNVFNPFFMNCEISNVLTSVLKHSTCYGGVKIYLISNIKCIMKLFATLFCSCTLGN